MVQDPNFWRRFSVAVHNEEAAILAAGTESGSKAKAKGKGETKHAYVVSLTSPIDSPSSIRTPTSQCHLFSPAFPPPAVTRPVSAPASALPPTPPSKEMLRKSAATSGSRSVYFDAPEEKLAAEEMIALQNLPSRPHRTLPPPPLDLTSTPTTPKSTHFALPSAPSTPRVKSSRFSRRASRFRFALSSHPPSLPATPTFPASTSSSPSSPSSPAHHSSTKRPTASKRSSRFTTAHKSSSRLSLGISLSGRPKSAFKFWTTIEADPAACRDSSWLEGQQRKSRQRAYMCWAFWGTFLVLGVGAVVAVLVLKGKGVI